MPGGPFRAVTLLLAMPAQASEPLSIPGLSGHYVEVGVERACRIDIEKDESFVAACPGEETLRGTVHARGDILGFGVRVDPGAFAEGSREYWAALGTFMDEHMTQHRFYPLVLPPKAGGLLPLVPVSGPRGQYLVDLEAQDHFCAAATTGRSPLAAGWPRSWYRRLEGAVAAGIPWRTFCEPGWRPHLQHLEPGR